LAKLIFLGTASAVAFEGHENTFMVIQGEQSSILVDCASNPILKLRKAGIHFEVGSRKKKRIEDLWESAHNFQGGKDDGFF